MERSEEVGCIKQANFYEGDVHMITAKKSIKSIVVIEGDGDEFGCIKQANFCEGGYMRHRIDDLDKDNFLCKYSLIEGDVLGDKIESVVYAAKFEATSDGGCLLRLLLNSM
ncbi:hypothetical protein QYF36_004589 [Acer negundo]|nr:hypothetical protein QYF36_004589 [Acer negundo]